MHLSTCLHVPDKLLIKILCGPWQGEGWKAMNWGLSSWFTLNNHAIENDFVFNIKNGKNLRKRI